MIEPYTVALTSCGRFDLLERTLASLLPRLEHPVEKILIIEDSGDIRVKEVVGNFDNAGIHIETIVNNRPLGQIRSIDRLYSHIDTEWIFHCEDDWEFTSSGFVAKSFSILKEFDSCSMLSLRTLAEIKPDRYYPEAGGQFYVAKTKGYRFAGLHFNPGLRRMRDYRIIGPYANIGKYVREKDVSKFYSDLGYRVLCLNQPIVRHIGDKRHVGDPTLIPGRYKKLYRSISRRFVKLQQWTIKQETNPFVHAQKRFEQARPSMSRWRDWDENSNSKNAT